MAAAISHLVSFKVAVKIAAFGRRKVAEARHRIAYETRKVRRGDSYAVDLAPGGGLAIRLAPGR